MWFKTTGTIKYDPYRGTMKKRTKWWCIIEVDREIARYYRWWVMNRYWINLYQPSWDAHVSIIRGEEPPDHLKNLWKKYVGQKVEVWYNHDVKQVTKNGKDHFWYVDAKCDLIKSIREEFNFPTNWGNHLTIGRTY